MKSEVCLYRFERTGDYCISLSCININTYTSIDEVIIYKVYVHIFIIARKSGARLGNEISVLRVNRT